MSSNLEANRGGKSNTYPAEIQYKTSRDGAHLMQNKPTASRPYVQESESGSGSQIGDSKEKLRNSMQIPIAICNPELIREA
jgi:hypothetical protein